MNETWLYEIRVEGLLAERWSDWFEGLSILHEAEGRTLLVGILADQAALYGVLDKIHGLNLSLVSVVRVPGDERDRHLKCEIGD